MAFINCKQPTFLRLKEPDQKKFRRLRDREGVWKGSYEHYGEYRYVCWFISMPGCKEVPCDPRVIVEEAKEMLKDGGAIYIKTPDEIQICDDVNMLVLFYSNALYRANTKNMEWWREELYEFICGNRKERFMDRLYWAV